MSLLLPLVVGLSALTRRGTLLGGASLPSTALLSRRQDLPLPKRCIFVAGATGRTGRVR